jgi:hypothetical protein
MLPIILILFQLANAQIYPIKLQSTPRYRVEAPEESEKQPLVSVIMPVRGREELFRNAARSILD